MGEKPLFALLLTVAGIALVNGHKYCSIKTCVANGINYQRNHTLCRFQPNEISPRCNQRGNLGGGLTDAEKNAIVAKHNQLRQWVAQGRETRGDPGPQPPASNMQIMVWDDELAMIAQAWANQCEIRHDICRDVERYRVGQNIASNGTTLPVDSINILDMVQDWYDEVASFDRNDVRSFKSGGAKNGKRIGHYTQMVWANTNRIGCGVKNYVDGIFNSRYLVCNYGPTGNYLKQQIYKKICKKTPKPQI